MSSLNALKEWPLRQVLNYEGREVRYDQMGKGEPVVFVHGTPWSSFNLRHLIRLLAERYTVLYFDLLGYGQSDQQPGDVSLGIQNQVLDRLLYHWQLQDPRIIGHDFGGATVLRTHLLNQQSFQQIVLIDPVAVSPWGSPLFKHIRKYEEAFAGLPDYIHEAILRAYVATAAHQPLSAKTMEGILMPWQGTVGQPAFYRQIAQADSRYTDEVESVYSTISVPTLILWGEQDEWIPIERGQKLQSLISQSKLIPIENAGHLVIEEAPEQLASKIVRFFD